MPRVLFVVAALCIAFPMGPALAGQYDHVAKVTALEKYGPLPQPKIKKITITGLTDLSPSHWRAEVRIPMVDGQPPDRGQVLAAARQVFIGVVKRVGAAEAAVMGFSLAGQKSGGYFAIVDIEGDKLKFEWGPDWHPFGKSDGPKPVHQGTP